MNVVRPSFPMMMISWLVGPGCGCGGGSSVQFGPAALFHTRVGVWVAGCRVVSLCEQHAFSEHVVILVGPRASRHL